jgi:hypothetical protein
MQKIVAGAAIAVALCCSSVGQAASSACSALVKKGCACAVALPPSGPIAQLREISGNVVVARDVAYSPVRDPTRVGLNDQVRVGQGGAALLSVAGQCQLRLAGPEKVVLKLEAGCACVAQLPTDTAARTIASGSGGFDLAVPGAGAGAKGGNPINPQTAAVGGGLLIAGGLAAAVASGQSSSDPVAGSAPAVSNVSMVAAVNNLDRPESSRRKCNKTEERIAALATQLNKDLSDVSKDAFGSEDAAHVVKCSISEE